MTGKREHSAASLKIERLDDVIGLKDALNKALDVSKRKRNKQARTLKRSTEPKQQEVPK